MEKSAGPLLPIHAFEEEICDAVKGNDAIVLIGETGSGKTTQVSHASHGYFLTYLFQSQVLTKNSLKCNTILSSGCAAAMSTLDIAQRY
jgi:midasin (ATPase involved in ribosome maturation)